MAADVTAHFTSNLLPAILRRSKLKSIYSKWKMSDESKLKGWRCCRLKHPSNEMLLYV